MGTLEALSKKRDKRMRTYNQARKLALLVELVLSKAGNVGALKLKIKSKLQRDRGTLIIMGRRAIFNIPRGHCIRRETSYWGTISGNQLHSLFLNFC